MFFLVLAPDLFSLETLTQLAQQYGYWTVFLGILLENAGVPLPGETLTLVGGFLAGNGDL
jgi:membrane protein DedA with SNARE-associated domain